MPGFFKKLFGRTPETWREPQFAGHLYPEEPGALTERVESFLEDTAPEIPGRLEALVVPFAQLAVMGPVAAPAWRLARQARERIERVVLVGSAQRIPFQGVALPSQQAWREPAGDVWLDRELLEELAAMEQARIIDAAHGPEPMLEVQLPLLRRALGERARIVPVLMGDGGAERLEPILERAWDSPRTLVVVVTELAREVAAGDAERLGEEAAEAIERLDGEAISRHHASARVPLRALLSIARGRGLRAHRLDVRHTGQLGIEREQLVTERTSGLVLGFGSFALCAEP